MIHGVPEITARMRSKVENYAIYSVLFLSVSIALLVDPPNAVTKKCAEDPMSLDFWVCHLRRRAYLYGFAIGIAAHMLSILLAMAFVNALNEAARDSDVYRMFSRGKGFIATVKCQYAFRLGCAADYVAAFKECVKLNEEFKSKKGLALNVTQRASALEGPAQQSKASAAVAAIF